MVGGCGWDRTGFAARLRSRRRALGLTPGMLGRLSGRGRGAVTAWETGVAVPSAILLPRIAMALRVAPCHLAFGTGPGGDALPMVAVRGPGDLDTLGWLAMPDGFLAGLGATPASRLRLAVSTGRHPVVGLALGSYAVVDLDAGVSGTGVVHDRDAALVDVRDAGGGMLDVTALAGRLRMPAAGFPWVGRVLAGLSAA